MLDVASGRGGPALVLAGSFGCRLTCVEQSDEFHSAARQRVWEAGLESLIELVHADARDFPLGEDRYDAALCLGASFVWGGLAGTLAALMPAVRPSGSIAVGEPYWRTWPLPEDVDRDLQEQYVTLRATVERFEAAGLTPTTLIDSSLDDWDRYETLHWLPAEEWLEEHPDEPDAEGIRVHRGGPKAVPSAHGSAPLGWHRAGIGPSVISSACSQSDPYPPPPWKTFPTRTTGWSEESSSAPPEYEYPSSQSASTSSPFERRNRQASRSVRTPVTMAPGRASTLPRWEEDLASLAGAARAGDDPRDAADECTREQGGLAVCFDYVGRPDQDVPEPRAVGLCATF